VHVIGDSEEIHAMLGVLTGRHPDTHVQCFASGEAFLDQLATLEQGVVLLDFDLAGMDGLDLLTEIRCFATLFPVIARSDRHSIGLAVDAMKLGALDFLEKPHDLKSLFAAIEDGFGVIENARTLEEQQRVARISDGDDALVDRLGA
jgi:two-component system response regulator FixJ